MSSVRHMLECSLALAAMSCTPAYVSMQGGVLLPDERESRTATINGNPPSYSPNLGASGSFVVGHPLRVNSQGVLLAEMALSFGVLSPIGGGAVVPVSLSPTLVVELDPLAPAKPLSSPAPGYPGRRWLFDVGVGGGPVFALPANAVGPLGEPLGIDSAVAVRGVAGVWYRFGAPGEAPSLESRILDVGLLYNPVLVSGSYLSAAHHVTFAVRVNLGEPPPTGGRDGKKGEKGEKGEKGDDGKDGKDGLSTVSPPAPKFSGTVYFELECANVSTSDHLSIQRIASEYRTRPSGSKIYVVGHADQSGPSALNNELATRRALNVRTELLNQPGITPSDVSLSVTSCGDVNPVVDTPKGREPWNRRVEIYLEDPRHVPACKQPVHPNPGEFKICVKVDQHR